jgi:hypothetical protein
MKLISLILLLVLSHLGAHAQDELFNKDNSYRTMKNSLIQWDKLDPVDYLDYDLWLKDTKLRDKWPEWEKTVREKRQRELVGKVLHCVGECRMYRGVGHYTTQFRSSVEEGDELKTSEDSYAWVFLLDGTMVRMSPSTSVTFREINVGKNETFFHVRINSGNVVWISRSTEKFVETNTRETDTIFFPLQFYEAMPITEKAKYDEDSLFNLLEETNTVKNQYVRLNKLIEENNKNFSKRKSFAFIVTPNGTVSGENLNVEFISLLGNQSFVKSRTYKQIGLNVEEGSSDATFYFRGFDNKANTQLEAGKWYRIGQRGRDLTRYLDTQLQQVGELLTKRIPSIFVARELLLKEYSKYKNFTNDPFVLARKFGFRTWGKMEDPKSDMALRLQYLIEYTRRMETTTLLTSSRLREKLIARGEPTDDMEYSIKFFNKALVNYMRYTGSVSVEGSDREVLNSTTKKYWKIINDIK